MQPVAGAAQAPVSIREVHTGARAADVGDASVHIWGENVAGVIYER